MLKKIDGFDRYFINEHGQVYSITNTTSKKLKTNYISGYYAVGLYSKSEKKQKMFYIHRLMATTFIPNPENKPCVNHKDGNKLNNSLENLEWCTYAENTRHAYDMFLAIPRRLSEEEKERRQIEHQKNYNLHHNVVCVQTHEIFKNSIEAAKKLKCSRQLVSKALITGSTCKGYHFVRLSSII